MQGLDPHILSLCVALISLAVIFSGKWRSLHVSPLIKQLCQEGKRGFLYVSPILLVGLIFFMYIMMYNALILCQDNFGLCDPYRGLEEAVNALLTFPVSAKTRLTAYSGQLMWLLAMGLCLFFSIGAVVGGTYVIYKSLNRRLFNWFLIGAIGAVSVIIAILFTRSHSGDPVHPWRQIVHFLLEDDLKIAVEWTPNLDIIALAIGAYLAIAVSIVLLHLYTEHIKPDEELTKDQLLVYSNRFRLVLYVGALLLVVSTFRMSTLFSWALSYLDSSSPSYQHIDNIVSVILITQGCFYTMLLAVVYLPSILILRQTARKIAAQLGTEEQEELLKHFSFTHHLPRFAAILAPLLTGPASEILTALSELYS